MSRKIADQDWEVDTAPFTATGQMVRTSTDAIDGTDMVGGDGTTALAGIAQYEPPQPSLPESGSQKNMRLWCQFKFKVAVNNTGGAPSILVLTGAASSLLLQKFSSGATSGKLSLNLSGTTVAGPTTIVVGTVYDIELDYRETSNGVLVRVYLNGVLEIELTNIITTLQRLTAIGFGTTSEKITWKYVWGRFHFRQAIDPIVA